MLVNKEAFSKITCRLVCKLPTAFKKKDLHDILAAIKMLLSNIHKAMIITANHGTRNMQSGGKMKAF